MVQLQFPEKTLIGQAILLQELLAHPTVKGPDEITRQIIANARLLPQAVRDLKSYVLHKLCRAGGIMKFPRNMIVGPGPDSLGCVDNTPVDWLAP
jgi:hypothetical protein